MSEEAYLIAHTLLGFVSTYDNTCTMDIMFMTYQFGQLYYDKRYFIHKNEFEEGNDITHTLSKISSYYTGKGISYSLNRCFNIK